APPVILGGAALNRRYVEEDLRAIYRGELFYGEDAFDGLRIMDQLAARKRIRNVGSAVIAGVMDRPRARRPDSVTEATRVVEPPAYCTVHAAPALRSDLPPAPNI